MNALFWLTLACTSAKAPGGRPPPTPFMRSPVERSRAHDVNVLLRWARSERCQDMTLPAEPQACWT